MTATVAYECEICAEGDPDESWVLSVTGVMRTPDGKQVCKSCWNEHRTENDWPAWEDGERVFGLFLAEENPEDTADRMDALAGALIEVTRTLREERKALDFLAFTDFDKRERDKANAAITRATEELNGAGYSLDDEIPDPKQETMQ